MIPTKEELLEVFEYKDGLLFWKVNKGSRAKAGDIVGSDTGNGYLKVCLNKRYYKLHRIIWILHFGSIPDDLVIDHIDGNGFNNNILNLRLATNKQNQYNRVKRTHLTSKYKGVNYDKARNKWKAEFRAEGVSYHIGRFDTEEEAKKAYDEVTSELYGDFFKGN